MSGIVGIGLDLIDLEHFRIHYGSEDPDLLARCFTDREIVEAASGPDRLARLAARFAAKEAAFKALGGATGVSLTDIELLRDDSGAPRLCLHGPALALAQKCGADNFFVSLSHSTSATAAVVIAVSGGPR